MHGEFYYSQRDRVRRGGDCADSAYSGRRRVVDIGAFTVYCDTASHGGQREFHNVALSAVYAQTRQFRLSGGFSQRELLCGASDQYIRIRRDRRPIGVASRVLGVFLFVFVADSMHRYLRWHNLMEKTARAPRNLASRKCGGIVGDKRIAVRRGEIYAVFTV